MHIDLRVNPRRIALPAEAQQERHGFVHIDFASTVDAPLLLAEGEKGSIQLILSGGRIDGSIVAGDERRHLDAEDALGLTDGRTHSLTLSVNETGTHVYVDGYEAFSATLEAWFADLGITELRVDPSNVMKVSRVAVAGPGLTAHNAVALAVPATPFVEFAASALSERDARRCSDLRVGAIRATFHTRGRGQQGVALAAEGSTGVLRLGIEDGNLYYRVWNGEELIVEAVAPGRWDDGNDHDVVVVVGRGAVDIYADGYQVIHEPGMAFFTDCGEINRVLVGADLDGTRLFGEASAAFIYDSVLSDHQVKRLASAEPLDTRALFDTGLLDSKSYRIPSILTLKSGVVIAGADQRVSIPNDSPNDINFVIRRSLDGGETWEETQSILTYPGDGGVLGSSVIDSVLVQDEATERVFVVIDMFPGGIGQPNCEIGRGFDDQGRMILHNSEGATFLLLDDGSVTTVDGEPTEYQVDKRGNVNAGGNIYLASGVDKNETLLLHRTSYLQVITSDDDGATWSDPVDINNQVKEDWMRFLGTSPGNGIQLKRGPHAGRILVPIYYNNENKPSFSCAALYTDDHGATWHRGESPNDNREIDGQIVHSRDLTYEPAFTYESVFVEGENGNVHVWMRNQNPAGRIAHSVSHDGGETWGPVDFVDVIPEIFSQPNAIEVDVDGSHGILFANASQLVPFRGRGVLRLSLDDGATWTHNRVFNPRHYVYQCMTQLPDGRIGLLWERERQGLFFTVIPLSWLTDSLQG